MDLLDWYVIGAYFILLLLFGYFIGQENRDQDDYYVADRKLSWWAVGISTMATQSSAISFISIPAFVAVKEGGGLTWLQYELALPLAMIVTSIFLIPLFRKLKLVSVYEYLQLRYGTGVRNTVAVLFLLSRALGTGIALYATAIVMQSITGFELWISILTMGLIILIYDTLGGMRAVVYSDIFQMGLLLLGVIVSIAIAVDLLGGFGAIVDTFPKARLQTLDFGWGLGSDGGMPFWAFLFGGFFLYTAYYGTDQSQVQRELSARSIEDAKRSLYFNGFARFPLTLLYVLMGITVGTLYLQDSALQASVAASSPDHLIPQFILAYLPGGVKGLLIAAILAAAMSSIDSALNSLSAVTLHDFVLKEKHTQGAREIRLSQITTLFWGIAVILFALMVGVIADTVIEAINKIGSAFYGPVLAVFLAGALHRHIGSSAILTGLVGGVGVNLFLWLFHPEVMWMWWNVTGFVVAYSGAWMLSMSRFKTSKKGADYTAGHTVALKWTGMDTLLACYFLMMLIALWLIDEGWADL
ncbi:sodium:solute symporter family transporter [Sulfurimonas diazotrophicus]|uniref:Sodium/solute symporter n=1 Tax=Sulfurimonas diazotrophicus TaxID=3131939 RepID=A0ABZ3HC22_9BACT